MVWGSIKKQKIQGLTQKQKLVLKNLSLRDHPVTCATLGVGEGVLGRMMVQGLVQRSTQGVGNMSRLAWEITRNGLILQNMIEPGSGGGSGSRGKVKITKKEQEAMTAERNARMEALGLVADAEYRVLLCSYRIWRFSVLNAPDFIVEKERVMLAERIAQTGTTPERLEELRALHPKVHAMMMEEEGASHADGVLGPITVRVARRFLQEVQKPGAAPKKPHLRLVKK